MGGGGAVPSGAGHISFLDCPNVSTPAGYDAAISNTVVDEVACLHAIPYHANGSCMLREGMNLYINTYNLIQNKFARMCFNYEFVVFNSKYSYVYGSSVCYSLSPTSCIKRLSIYGLKR